MSRSTFVELLIVILIHLPMRYCCLTTGGVCRPLQNAGTVTTILQGDPIHDRGCGAVQPTYHMLSLLCFFASYAYPKLARQLVKLATAFGGICITPSTSRACGLTIIILYVVSARFSFIVIPCSRVAHFVRRSEVLSSKH
jgi:hypothetical protein